MAEYLKEDAEYQIGELFPVTKLKKLPSEKYRETKGTVFSKQFSNTAAITKLTKWCVPIDQTDQDNYMMFNRLRVINNSDNNIEVRFNGSQDTNLQVLVPSQTMAIWGEDDKKLYQTIDIYNDNSLLDIPIGKITVNIIRVN